MLNEENKVRAILYAIFCLLSLGYIAGCLHAQNTSLDQQIVLIYTQAPKYNLTYNVTAIAQNNIDNFGPYYLLNAMTSQGYMYQFGLGYNLPGFIGESLTARGSVPYYGFSVHYEVLYPNGTTYEGGILLNGYITNEDKVLMRMSFNNSQLIMYLKDWNSSATAVQALNVPRGDYFVGTPESNCTSADDYCPVQTDSDGFFTGLMTELEYLGPSSATEEMVTYSPIGPAPPGNSILWIQDFCLESCNYTQYAGRDNLYWQNMYFWANSTQIPRGHPYNISIHNASARLYSNGTFVTGTLPDPPPIKQPIRPLYLDKIGDLFIFDVNQTFGFQYLASELTGGTPPYTYNWTFDGKHVGGNTITLTRLGYNNLTVRINDSINLTTSANWTIDVNPLPTLTVKPNRSIIFQQGKVLLKPNVTGGSQPFGYTIYVNGKLASHDYAISLNGSGIYAVNVVVNDDYGNKASATLDIYVLGSYILYPIPVAAIILFCYVFRKPLGKLKERIYDLFT